MRLTMVAALAGICLAACSPAAEEWVETTQVAETPSLTAAPTADAARFSFALSKTEPPTHATLSPWSFSLKDAQGRTAAFRQTPNVELNLKTLVVAAGKPTPILDIVREALAENPVAGLYDAETPADWIACPDGRALTHVVHLSDRLSDSLAMAFYGFAGQPGQAASTYCGVRMFAIPQS